MSAPPQVSHARGAVAAGLDRVAGIAFAALVVLMPFRLHVDPLPHPAIDLSAPLSDVVLYAIDGLIVVVLVAWLVARLADRRAVRLGPRPLVLPAAILLVLAWATLPFGVVPFLSLFGAVRLTALLALAIYVVNEVGSVARLAVPVGLMLGIQAVVAIAEYLQQGSIGLQGIGELTLSPTTPGIAVVVRADGLRVIRAYGLSTHPNVLGGFLATGTLLLLAARPTRSPGRVLQLGIVGLALGGLLVTFSRGAWLGLGVGGIVAIAILGRRALRADRRFWLAVGGVMLVVAAVGGWQVRDELAVRAGLSAVQTETERRSIDERSAQIQLGARVLAANPVIGVGMSAVPVAMERLDPAFPWSFYPPHLVPLTVAAELGAGGGLAFLALVAAPWWLLLRRRGTWDREMAAVSGALAAVLVAGLFDDYPWVGGPGRTLFWVLLAAWAAMYMRAPRCPEPAG